MFEWRFVAEQVTSFLYLLSILGYIALKTYPEVTLTWHHSFKVDVKTALDGYWPMQVFISHSIPDLFMSVYIALLVSGCAFPAILFYVYH